jgi:hypothetical protein
MKLICVRYSRTWYFERMTTNEITVSLIIRLCRRNWPRTRRLGNIHEWSLLQQCTELQCDVSETVSICIIRVDVMSGTTARFWIVTPYLHGWSPENVSLHPVALKASDLIQCLYVSQYPSESLFRNLKDRSISHTRRRIGKTSSTQVVERCHFITNSTCLQRLRLVKLNCNGQWTWRWDEGSGCCCWCWSKVIMW